MIEDDYDIIEGEDEEEFDEYIDDDQPLTSTDSANWGLYAGLLALVSTIVLVGLTSIIYHRDKTTIPLLHLILSIIGLLFAAFACWVFFTVTTSN